MPMCGVAGLFLGCAVSLGCPLALPPADRRPESDATAEERDYQSPFDGWYDGAAVRSAPRRVVAEEGYVFSPDFVPIASHPLVRALPEHQYREVITRHAYRYLDFTAVLESAVVNPLALAIARGTTQIDVPAAMRLDAYKIYCDEAYHALFSADLAAQARLSTGVAGIDSPTPYFMRRLSELHASCVSSHRSLVDLLFVICSEMLISGTLTQIRPHPEASTGIYEAVRDHAKDEGRHHAYFSQLLGVLWGQLDSAHRKVAALMIPSLVAAFMDPDIPAMRRELVEYDLTSADVEEILAVTYSADVVRPGIEAAATHIVRAMRDLDALGDEEVLSQFVLHGIIAAPGGSGTSEARST